MKSTLSILVHGESGAGKSWFGDSAPYPLLVLDAEGRAKYTPSGPKVLWDPLTGPPPVADGTWHTCVVTVTDFNVMTQVYQWLRSGQHQFRSVCIDSLMELQKRCQDQIAGTSALDQQNWGELLRKLEALVRSYRDLTLLPTNNVEVVVFIVGTKDVDGTRRPLLQGALRDTVPYYLDVVGYLYVTADEAGQPVRQLLVQPLPGFVAKDGTGRLPGPVIPNPNLGQLHELLKVNGKPEGIEPTPTQEATAA